MPRYYFRLEPDGPVDLEGEVLSDADAARELAAAIARELSKNDPRMASKRVAVFDGTGAIVHETELTAT